MTPVVGVLGMLPWFSDVAPEFVLLVYGFSLLR